MIGNLVQGLVQGSEGHELRGIEGGKPSQYIVYKKLFSRKEKKHNKTEQ